MREREVGQDAHERAAVALDARVPAAGVDDVDHVVVEGFVFWLDPFRAQDFDGRAGAAIKVLRAEWIKPENKALHNHMVDIIDTGGWNARVERHRRPLMSILSNLALPHDALRVILSFWSPPGGR